MRCARRDMHVIALTHASLRVFHQLSHIRQLPSTRLCLLHARPSECSGNIPTLGNSRPLDLVSLHVSPGVFPRLSHARQLPQRDLLPHACPLECSGSIPTLGNSRPRNLVSLTRVPGVFPRLSPPPCLSIFDSLSPEVT